MDGIAKNTDKEIWRERLEDFYSDSIHVTADGRIGINSGGHVIVMPASEWHGAAVREISRESRNQNRIDERLLKGGGVGVYQ